MQQNNDKKPGLSWSTPAQQNTPKQPAPVSSTAKQLLPPAEGKSGAAVYAGMFVGGLIVGVLLAWGWSTVRQGDSPTSTASSTQMSTTNTRTNTSTANMVRNGMVSEDITVPSPQEAGQSVIVSEAQVGSPTWVVVYEDRDGQPGNILGAQLFFTSGPGIVTLLRATEAGQTYYVGKAVDDGDRKFTKTNDKPSINLDGTLSVVPFTAQ